MYRKIEKWSIPQQQPAKQAPINDKASIVQSNFKLQAWILNLQAIDEPQTENITSNKLGTMYLVQTNARFDEYNKSARTRMIMAVYDTTHPDIITQAL